MIEDCCKKAGGDIEKYLFKAVTNYKASRNNLSDLRNLIEYFKESPIKNPD